VRDQLAPVVAELSKEAAQLLRTQDERVWRHWVEGAPLDLASTYEGKEALFSAKSIQAIDQLRQELVRIAATQPEGKLKGLSKEIRALTHLHVHFVGEYLSASLADLSEAIANLEASLTFTVDGQEYAYRDLQRLLANERSSEKRKALAQGAAAALDRLSQSLRRRHEKAEVVLKELGYPSYDAFAAELRQVNLEQLDDLAQEVLTVTEEAYHQVMDALAERELQLAWSDVRRADLPRLFSPQGVDPAFPRDEQLSRIEETLAGLGLELDEMPNVRLDNKPAPKKNPRPLTVGVAVPSDVRLSLVPQEGLREQAALLHEVAHAMHLAQTTETRFELAKLGNGTVAEAYARLFEDLLEDPVWLENHARLTGVRLQQHLRAASAQRLYRVRRTAGRLLYQLELAQDGAGDARAVYKEVMTRTLGITLDERDTAQHLVDRDDFYEAADTFRAGFLAAQLQAQLKARFGPTWWRSKDAGRFLKDLWSQGQALTADEVAQRLGEKSVRPDALLVRLSTTLGVTFRPPPPPAPPPPAPAPAPPPAPATPPPAATPGPAAEAP
jgi:hypothetical protein